MPVVNGIRITRTSGGRQRFTLANRARVTPMRITCRNIPEHPGTNVVNQICRNTNQTWEEFFSQFQINLDIGNYKLVSGNNNTGFLNDPIDNIAQSYRKHHMVVHIVTLRTRRPRRPRQRSDVPVDPRERSARARARARLNMSIPRLQPITVPVNITTSTAVPGTPASEEDEDELLDFSSQPTFDGSVAAGPTARRPATVIAPTLNLSNVLGGTRSAVPGPSRSNNSRQPDLDDSLSQMTEDEDMDGAGDATAAAVKRFALEYLQNRPASEFLKVKREIADLSSDRARKWRHYAETSASFLVGMLGMRYT